MSGQNALFIHEPWLKVGCTLGEGPLFDFRTSTLHFVDISEQKVYHVFVPTGAMTVETFDEPISCLVLRSNGKGLACAAAQGFALMEGNSSLRYLCQPLPEQERPHTRFNDGGCDRHGRFFAGTIMSAEPSVPGRLYCYDPSEQSCEVVDGPFSDCNGIGWSPDDATMYFTDSLVNRIYAYDYEDGRPNNRRLFADTIDLGFATNTYPDGLCIDDEGYIWSARWGGSRVVRFSPDGTVDFQVMFPTALNVTACCFGGENNDQMFVTTAHCKVLGGDPTRQEQYPDSGHVFLIDFAGRFKGRMRYEFGG